MTCIAGEYMYVGVFTSGTLWVSMFCQEGCRRKKEKTINIINVT